MINGEITTFIVLIPTPDFCYEMDKTGISMFEILEPGVSFGQIQHLRGLNSIALGYLNFTAGLT